MTHPYPPYPPQSPYPYPQQLAPYPPPSGTLGIVALCVGVPSLLAALMIPVLFWWAPLIPAAAAIIVGFIGYGRQYANRKMALWGAICGIVAVLACCYGAYLLNQAVDEFTRDLEQIEREFGGY